MNRKEKQRACTIRTYPTITGSPMTGVIGTVSELRVAADLFQRGYYVFRALSPHCPCDLIGLKDNQLTRFEVRTGTISQATGKIWADRRMKADILVIVLATQIIYEPPLP